LKEEQFNKCYDEVHDNFESVRMDVYNLLMESDVERSTARAVMQKAYVTYATLSTLQEEGGEAVRSRWADQVTEAAQ